MAIKRGAFESCTGLTRVILGNGLEEIGKEAFEKCTSMEEIVIPPAVKKIHDIAFKDCTNLTRIKFCDEIEKFVSCDAMRDWWNRGVHEKSLRTYCFMVRCSIPARLGLVQVRSWQANIYNMLSSIPTFSAADSNSNDEDMDVNEDSDEDEDDLEDDSNDEDMDVDEDLDEDEDVLDSAVVSDNSNVDSYSNDEDEDEYTEDDEDDYEEDIEDEDESLTAHFDAINARLTVYENMREAHKLLGLVIQNNDIVQRVLSFF
jgi:hypothetical protein